MIVLAGLAFLLIGVLTTRVHAPETDTPSNVVFILIDALRADRLEAERNGVPVTPYLAQLARESRHFTHAVTPCSWTRPAMASLFTAQYVDTHRVYYSIKDEKPDDPNPKSDKLADGWVTMAEYLERHGYDSFAIQTNANLIPATGFAQGYPAGQYLFRPEFEASDVTATALERLPKLKQPFFLYTHYMDPHVPYAPPERYRTLFGPAPPLTETDQTIFANFMDFYMDRVNLVTGRIDAPEMPMLSSAGKETMLALYDGEARFADDEVGRLIEGIRKKYPNTLIIVCADHGEEFLEHGGMGHGTSLFEEQLRIPFLIHGPRVAAERIDTTVSAIGLLPTVADYLGLPRDPCWQGRGLLGSLEPTPAFSRTLGPWRMLHVDAESVVEGHWKLILDNTKAAKGLYNLQNDPGERTNLAAQEPERTKRLMSRLVAHRKSNREGRPPGLKPEEAMLDEETRAQLEAIGYAGGKTKKAEAKNVVLVIADTLRADRIDAQRNGLPIMPATAALAQQSWRFTHCIAQATWTKPSVVSILSGLYPETHQVQFGTQKPLVPGQKMVVQTIPAGIELLGAYFKRAGYATAAMQSNYHLPADYGFGRGFDHYRLQYAPAETITAQAIELAQGLEAPFFLYVHYMDPHHPYEAREPYFSDFGTPPPLTPQDRELLENTYGQHYYLDKMLHDLGIRPKRYHGTFTLDARENIRQRYDCECRYLDRELARLIEAVGKLPGETVFVVTADHGEEFWEHGSIGHSKTVYQELAHVPLIIQGPGTTAKTVAMPVQTIDIAPTLAAYLGLDPLPQWQGRSLLGLIEGRDTETRPAITQTRATIPEVKLHLEAITCGTEKLIVNRKTGETALYDLAADPGETRNLAALERSTAERLRARLDEEKAAMARHPAASFKPPVVSLNETDRAALENLGYIGPDK